MRSYAIYSHIRVSDDKATSIANYRRWPKSDALQKEEKNDNLKLTQKSFMQEENSPKKQAELSKNYQNSPKKEEKSPPKNIKKEETSNIIKVQNNGEQLSPLNKSSLSIKKPLDTQKSPDKRNPLSQSTEKSKYKVIIYDLNFFIQKRKSQKQKKIL